MSKDKFLRSNVHSDLLSKVIFRVDIAGITDLKGYINRVKGLESIRNAFGRVLPIRSRSINFVIDAQHAEYNKFTQEPEIDEGFRLFWGLFWQSPIYAADSNSSKRIVLL